MIAWMEVELPNKQTTNILVEVLTIKKKTVEVCSIDSRDNYCIWVPHDELFIQLKANAHISSVVKIETSRFWELLS
jgi:hypothetical protein